MEGIKRTFAQCKAENRAALVTYVTAGYPTAAETVDILLGLEAGGAGELVLALAEQAANDRHRPDRARIAFY